MPRVYSSQVYCNPGKYELLDLTPYSGVRLIAIALIAICSISKLFLFPKRAFNVNFVPLIASSPISKEISCKCDLLLREHHCTKLITLLYKMPQLILSDYNTKLAK